MLNDRIALGDEVKLSVQRVVDSDLLWTHMQLAVDSLVYEGRTAYTSCVNFAISQVLRIYRLDLERKVNCAIFQVFNNDILFAKVFRFDLSDVNTFQILNA